MEIPGGREQLSYIQSQGSAFSQEKMKINVRMLFLGTSQITICLDVSFLVKR